MRIADVRALAGPIARTAFFALATTLTGCATEPIPLQVRTETDRPIKQITRPIAFVHPREFREQQETIEPYGNKYFLHLKAGEASDKALRETYARLFAASHEVSSRDQLSRLAGPDAPEALLEPSIVALHYLNASRRMEGPFYAEIEYRFTLTDLGGASIANWVVRGFGQYDLRVEARARTKDSPPGPRGEEGILVEAPRRAIEVAIGSLPRSFERVPELIRWSRGEPVVGTDVAPDRQVKHDLGPQTPGIEAAYPGAFALRVQRTPIPMPPKGVVEEEAPELNLLAVRITLRNESSHRLALDPAEVEWDAGLNMPLEPIPAPVAAAVVTRLPFGLTVATGPGIAALPALVAALISAAENVRHEKEFAAWSAAVAGEVLVDGIAPGGETRTGLVYFQKSPKLDGGSLVVRVIDLDDALRYTVRIPIQGTEPTTGAR